MKEWPVLEDRTDEYKAIAEAGDYELRKAVTVWVFNHLLAHAREGGSYRGLIYERLGFGADAYADLFEGQILSNLFHDIRRLDAVKNEVARLRLAALKEPLQLCDVEGCFEEFVASGDGRRTCQAHNHRL